MSISIENFLQVTAINGKAKNEILQKLYFLMDKLIILVIKTM